jgi:hypothetical protein
LNRHQREQEEKSDIIGQLESERKQYFSQLLQSRKELEQFQVKSYKKIVFVIDAAAK